MAGGLIVERPVSPFSNIVIFGIGLIGGSIAYAIADSYGKVTVRGVDADAKTVKRAIDEHIVDACVTPDSSEVDAWLADPSLDLVIIATPVSASRDIFARIEASGYAGTVTDVSSTKRVIVGYAEEELSDTARFIPGHPMAGSEVNGLDGARPKLFNGSYWILCPGELCDPERFTRLHEFVTGFGSRVISVNYLHHDDVVAIVSHVPHMVATALVQLAGNHSSDAHEIFRLAAGGFKDTTRIAAGSPALWCGIALDNSEALADGLSEIEGILGDIEKAVRAGDSAHLTEILASSSQLRRSLPSAWIPDSSALIQVRIPMSDRSGVIADVTGIAGKAACNIQSIDIDHINEDNAVLELILTDEGDIGKFTTQLLKKGFDFSLRPLADALEE